MYRLKPSENRAQFAGLEIGASWASYSQSGISLFEALITLLVVTVGLLGIAAMQVVGVQEGASALRQSRATWLAYEMADRIRANLNPAALNPEDVSAGPTDIADHYNDIEVAEDIPPTGQICGPGNNCSLQQMAHFDADQWRLGILDLPGGRGTVEEDDTVGGRYRIRVMWDEIRAGVDAPETGSATGCPTDDISVDQSDWTRVPACVETWVQP